MALAKGVDGRGRLMKGTDASRLFKTSDQPTARELRRKEERRLKRLKKGGQAEPVE
jgi:hypothetical protein